MKSTSYGIIPLKKIDGVWHTYLLKHVNGAFWGFPKGHMEFGESPKQAAIRELKEEANLDVLSFVSDEPLKESYQFYKDDDLIDKEVYFYVALVDGIESLQAEEILDGKWLNIADAKQLINYDEGKNLVDQVEKIL